MVRSYSYILILLFTSLIFAQEDKVAEKQSELGRIRNEINALQNEISLKTKKEKETFSVVEIYSRQGHLLNKLINELKEEEQVKQSEINRSREEIKRLEKNIKELQDNYARYITALYKKGKVPEWSALINAESLNQALLRIDYLKRFSDRREKDLVKLRESKEEIAAAKVKLESELKEKTKLTAEKQAEEKVLVSKINERKKILSAIKKDKAELKKELDAKKGAEQKIKNLIVKLVEEAERKRREEAARLAALEREKLERNNKQIVSENKNTAVIKNEVASAGFDIDLSTTSFSSFAAARGKLKWPVNGGKVTGKYGESKNKLLNTVTMNNGIDIKTVSDHSVFSVADGVVSAIDWIPGYGSVIIITHKGDYRTVYGHLAEIYVKEGTRVKPGSLIAKTAESTEGNILHFEIWNSRNNQNPELWLSKK